MSEAHRLPFPEDVLLEHRAWVRALARTLVRDAAAAEDLEQDTWVRALESMPRDVRSPRAWLGTVLRNRFRDGLRTRGRRGLREEAVARGGAHPAAADVAAATVRTRLHRGLANLRKRLDAQHGGGGDRWKRALAPLLLPATLPERVAAPRRPYRVPVAVATTVALVAVWVLLVPALPRATTRPRMTPTSAATSTGVPAVADATDAGTTPRKRKHMAVSVPRQDDPGTRASPGRAADPATVALDAPRVRVTVVDAAGAPVVGARVQIVNGDSFAKSGFARVLAETTTDATGAAAFASPVVEEVRLVARAAGRAAISSVMDREDVLKTPQRLRLEAATELSGTLVTPGGEGIPGARIALTLTGDVFGPGGVQVCDKAGRFTFPSLPRGAFATPANLEIVADGFPYTNHPATLADVTGAGMRIVLTPAVTLTGRCVDADGRAIGAVWVSCSHAVGPDETPGSGTFTISGIDGSGKGERAVSLNFECETHAPRRIVLTDAMLAAGDLGDVVLDMGATIRGRVVDPDGKPVPRASVSAEGLTTQQIARQGQTDDEGRFVFEHCGDERHEIVASGPAGDAFSGLTGVVKDVRPSEDDVVVRISAAQTVLVELVNAETGEPLTLTNVLVFIEPLDGDEDDEAGSAVFSEDGFRTVRVRAKRPGAYKLTVRSFDGWGEYVEERIVVRDDQELRVQAKLRRE